MSKTQQITCACVGMSKMKREPYSNIAAQEWYIGWRPLLSFDTRSELQTSQKQNNIGFSFHPIVPLSSQADIDPHSLTWQQAKSRSL